MQLARPRSRAHRWAGHLAGLTAASVLLGVAGPATPAHAAEHAEPVGITEGLALWYKLDAATGTTVTDASGNGRDGTVHGTAAWPGAGEGLGFNGSDTFVEMPDNVLNGMAAVTVSMDVRIDAAQATPYFLYGFGNTSGTAGNGYLFTTGNTFRTSLASGNWSTEQTTQPSPARALARSVWKHVTYTQTGSTGVLYEDGVEVARSTALTLTPGAIGSGTTTANHIGKSVYPGDKLFKGRIRDFRVYDRALPDPEVEQLARPVSAAGVADDKAALGLGDTGAVVADLTLPVSGTAGGSTITWASDSPSVVSATGTVTRPAAGEPAGHAQLTATLKKGTVTDTKTFDITVPAAFDDATATEEAAGALTVHDLDDVRGSLTLPSSGAYGTDVSWSSAKPAVVSPDGVVHRPAPGSGTTTVELTATVTRGAARATRVLTAHVPELPVEEALKGYMFSYFTGEGTADGEQVYTALSKGNDPLNWRELNDGKPVLTSTLGEKGLRDPFIIRSPEGDKFYQIATDLRIYGNGDWDGAQRTGSKSIMVWESTDLVHWTDQRLVKVSPDTAGNTWAPEAFYDEKLGSYVVFWASKLYADAGHSGDTYNRMMYATTRDFRTFSEPKVWIDRGYSVIDSTMIEHDGEYHRFSKDERNNSSSTPYSKFVFAEKSDSVLDPSYDFVAEGIGKGSMSAAEGPLVFKSNTEEKWYLFLDEFGGRGYIPFESTDLASGEWTPSTDYDLPAAPRHGTVLPVTQREYDRLLRAYQPDQLVESVEPVSVTTGIGDAPALPATVIAAYADGEERPASVLWDAVPASAYARPTTFTVAGSLPDGTALKAAARVEVLAPSGSTTGIAAATHPALKVDALVDNTAGRVTLPLTEGSDLTSLEPEFTLADGASISPASGSRHDFTTPVPYEVTGSDGRKRTWTVEALEMRSPVLPGLTADPEIARFGDTFYLYPTTDGFPGWSGTTFSAYSSTDLVHWKDHGVVLDLGPDVAWADGRAWAPAIEERNGKYYLYFCADTNIGVAVSDSPTGPFEDALGRPLVEAGRYPGQMIDPAVLTDDDGRSYLYWGNGRAYAVPLDDDMVSFDASEVTDMTPSGYNEATFVIKRGATYYFMWSENDTRDENYRVAYATGSSPTGPWTKRGVMLEKRPGLGIRGPGHHSVVQVPNTDDWYIAYHRFAVPGGDGTHRETTLDRLEFDSEGLIKKVVPTLSGVDPVTVARGTT